MNHAWTGGQYSLCRGVCALGVAIAFAAQTESWLAAIALAIVALLLGLGAWDRVAAVALACAWIATDAWAPEQRPIGLAIAGVLVLHAMTPPAPFGSIAALGRADPCGSWNRPPWIHAAGWVLLAAVDVHAFTPLLARIVGRPDFSLADSRWSWLACAFYLAPLWTPRRVVPWVWSASIALHVVCGVASTSVTGFDVASIAMLAVLHAFTFDPGWIVPRDRSATEEVFYDGGCGLCHRLVRLLLAEDRTGRAFRFAPLGGETFRTLISAADRAHLSETLVLRTQSGAPLVRSRAVLHVLHRLGGCWRMFACAGSIVSIPMLDAVYDGIARVRHRLFAAPTGTCPLIAAHLQRRFDP